VIVLAGDVGGTKTALALFDKTAGGLVLVRDDTMPSRGFESLEAAVEKFLASGPRPTIEAVCLGVAGPVVDGRCVATNLPWVIDERALSSAIPARQVKTSRSPPTASWACPGRRSGRCRPASHAAATWC
jgi:glucokinase